VKPEATWVKFYSGDGIYTSAIALDYALHPDVMVAHKIDGGPIPGPLGGPVRLIVPGMYGWKSVKWLNRIELIAKEHIGFWEERGYPNDARIRT
jgi:DMSO/TMAO reductase YedYZ molybdopterin-dependent catalytic subunit